MKGTTVPFRVQGSALAFLGAGVTQTLAWRAVRLLLILAVWGALALAALLLWFARDLPRPEDALAAVRRPGLTLEDRRGRVIATYGDLVGSRVTLAGLPRYLPEAAIDTEDRRFWTNPGIDPLGMLRAALVDLTHGRIVQGGSTITQQVAKNLFLSDARTFRRKVQELLLTVWLTQHYTKRQILEIWLNRVYLGDGAYGVDAAARLYFGVPASRLALWQAAVIAGLPRAPSRFNPRSDPEAAAARGRQVLQAMVEAGDLTQAAADAAAAQIRFSPPAGETAGWFSDWAARQAAAMAPAGADAIARTTLDSGLQRVATDRLDAMLASPAARAAHVGQGAVVAMDAATGRVLALVGGSLWRPGAYDRAVEARRQPGSAFKAFVYLDAFARGARPDETVLDAPISVGGWRPQDYERHYLGEVTLRRAFALSLNTAAVRVMLRYGGPDAVVETARRLGVTGKLPPDASIALGTGAVDLLALTGAYATILNGGWKVTPRGIAGLVVDGTDEAAPAPDAARVIAPQADAALQAVMRAVVTEGTGRAAALPGRDVRGKTGTTQDSRDAWFVGGADGVAIGVWMGNDDDSPMRRVTGGDFPAQLFREVAAAAR